MAVITWDGSASTNWATDANWDTGTAPTTNDDVIIPDTSSLNNPTLVTAGANVTVNSLFMAANATLVGGGYIVIVTGEADGSGATTNGFAVDIDGIISGELDIEIRTAATTNIDLNASSGSVWDLKINHASCVANMNSSTVVGNLTITAGQLTTGGHALTVTRKTYLGDNSAADSATLTCAGSAISLGAAYTSDYALVVIGGGTFAGGTGTHTIGSIYMQDNANAKVTLTDDVTTISSEYYSGNVAINILGTNAVFAHGSGTVTITFAGTSNITLRDKSLNNLIINHASADITLGPSALTVAGDLTITAGTLNTSGSNYALTVTGNTRIGPASGGADQATLTCNASAVSLGSGLTTDYGLTVVKGGTFVGGTGTHTMGSVFIDAFADAKCTLTNGVTTLDGEDSGGYTWRNNGGTFAHNDGTVTTNSSVDTKIRENTFYNLIINQSSSGKFVYWEDTSGNTCTVANDLTITMGRLRGLVASDTVTVTGDVSVAADGTFNYSSVWTGAVNHGSLTIASGGTYYATSGTTTLTGPYAGDHYLFHNSGTFTHNKGTVRFTLTSYGNCQSGGDEFYNVISAVEHEGLYGLQITDAFVVLNNLTIDDDAQISVANYTTTVYGNVFLNGDWSRANTSSATLVIKGLLTIGSTGWYRPSSGTNNLGGIRNLGGSVN